MRRTAMPPRSEPMARSEMKRSPVKPNRDKTPGGEKSPSRRKQNPRRDTGFPAAVRTLIDWRDSDMGALLPAVRCQCCGRVIRREDGSRQHRVARGAGGTRNPAVSSPVNGVWLCGSGVTGCHGAAEQRLPDMRERGLWLRQSDLKNLHLIPVRRWDGRDAWPTADGGWSLQPPGIEAA